VHLLLEIHAAAPLRWSVGHERWSDSIS
jgi:hypothetical protein